MQQPQVLTTVQHNTGPAQSPRDSNIRHRYQSEASIALGALQIVVGILAIVFNAAAMGIDAGQSPVGHGIWSGIFFIITGSLGICAGQKKTTGLIVAFMVMSILAAILCIFLLAIAASGIEEDKDHKCFYGFCWNTYLGYSDPDEDAKIAMNGLLVALALFEAIVSISSSAICCGGVCCGASGPTGVCHLIGCGPEHMHRALCPESAWTDGDHWPAASSVRPGCGPADGSTTTLLGTGRLPRPASYPWSAWSAGTSGSQSSCVCSSCLHISTRGLGISCCLCFSPSACAACTSQTGFLDILYPSYRLSKQPVLVETGFLVIMYQSNRLSRHSVPVKQAF